MLKPLASLEMTYKDLKIRPLFTEIKIFALKFHRSVPNVRNPALNSIRRYDARVGRARKRPMNILYRDHDFVPPTVKRQRRPIGVT